MVRPALISVHPLSHQLTIIAHPERIKEIYYARLNGIAIDLLRRTQELEKQKNMLYGIMLIVMGIALQALSYAIGGSDFKDFISGLLLGLSIGEMLVGVFAVGKSLAGR